MLAVNRSFVNSVDEQKRYAFTYNQNNEMIAVNVVELKHVSGDILMKKSHGFCTGGFLDDNHHSLLWFTIYIVLLSDLANMIFLV